MIRGWLVAAALVGFLSVAASAVATHLADAERAAGLLRSGALYGMVHAAALLAVTAIAQAHERVGLALTIAGWSFQHQPVRAGTDREQVARHDHPVRRSGLADRLGRARLARPAPPLGATCCEV